MKRNLSRRLEGYAVLLWEGIRASEAFGPEVERERLLEAADRLHALRMVLTGRACHQADTLCELAWARLALLDQELHRMFERRLARQEVRHVA